MQEPREEDYATKIEFMLAWREYRRWLQQQEPQEQAE